MEWLSYNFMRNAFIAILLITPLFGLVGTMIVNNKMSFFSDALGHSALTGIALGVLFGLKNPVFSMIGFAIIFALGISEVNGYQRSSTDTIIGVFSSTAIALGVVLLSRNGGFTKYNSYLVGDILSITLDEIKLLFIIFVITLVFWFVFYNKLLLLSINTSLAISKNIKVKLLEKAFIILIAVIVTVSIKWVGILIINSLLILPAASARNIAKNIKMYHIVSVGISIFSGITGLMLSYYINTATGATIVLISASIFFISFFISKLVNK